MRVLTTSLIAVASIALHFYACRLLFGPTAAFVILGIQVASGLWMAYEMIRAPTVDD